MLSAFLYLLFFVQKLSVASSLQSCFFGYLFWVTHFGLVMFDVSCYENTLGCHSITSDRYIGPDLCFEL